MHRQQLTALLLPLLAAPAQVLSSTLTCENIRVDGHSFDLSKLGGPHSVVTTRYEPNPPEHFNTTYTLDICKPLKKSGKGEEECPNGTRVCGITHLIKGEVDTVTDITAIAGNLENHGGSQFDFTPTRLSTSDSTSDSKKEGLRLVLKGGKHPLSGPVKERREQRAIIEFICDRNKTGTEGEWVSEDKYEKRSTLRSREDKSDDEKTNDDKQGDDKKDGDDKDGEKDGDKDEGESSKEHQLKNEDAALIWEGYGPEKDVDVLRLTWYTQYACEKRSDDDKGGSNEGDDSSHWGFFTWFIILAFLGIAAYLVFSSWLNYNRYGARGWDLLPHSDSIRDVPYLLKDWIRRVLNTVQGTGSRGGYSAV